MSSVEVSDVFDQLLDQNEQLVSEISLANECLKKFIEYKTFVDFKSDILRHNLVSNEWQRYERLSREVEECKSKLRLRLGSEATDRKPFTESLTPDESRSSESVRLEGDSTADHISHPTHPELVSVRVKTEPLSDDSTDIDDNTREECTASETIAKTDVNDSIAQQEDEEDEEMIARSVDRDLDSEEELVEDGEVLPGQEREDYLRCNQPDCMFRVPVGMRSLFDHHVNSHRSLFKPFICCHEGCGKRFISGDFLNRHLEKDHNGVSVANKPYKPRRGRKPKAALSESDPIQIRRSFVCTHKHCAQVFGSKDQLNAHLIERHIRSEDNKHRKKGRPPKAKTAVTKQTEPKRRSHSSTELKSGDGGAQWKKICVNKKLVWVKSSGRRTKSSDVNSDPDFVPNPCPIPTVVKVVDKKPVKCSFSTCEAKFATLEDMHSHMDDYHDLIKCPGCAIRFISNEQLLKHSRICPSTAYARNVRNAKNMAKSRADSLLSLKLNSSGDFQCYMCHCGTFWSDKEHLIAHQTSCAAAHASSAGQQWDNEVSSGSSETPLELGSDLIRVKSEDNTRNVVEENVIQFESYD